MFELTGAIYRIGQTEWVSDRFRKRECVVEIKSGKDGQYTELVKIDFVQDRADSLDDYTEGETVRINFDLKGREWNDKVFTSLQAWRIERAEQGRPVQKATTTPKVNVTQQVADELDNDDEIPF